MQITEDLKSHFPVVRIKWASSFSHFVPICSASKLFLENLTPWNRSGRRAFIITSQGDDKGDVSCDVSYSPKCKFCRVRPHQPSSCSHTHTHHADMQRMKMQMQSDACNRGGGRRLFRGGGRGGGVIMCESRWWRGWLRNNKWYQQQFLIDNCRAKIGLGLGIPHYILLKMCINQKDFQLGKNSGIGHLFLFISGH